MYSLCIIFVLLPFGFIIGANLPTRDQALLISKYAKVSRWGSVPSKQYSQGQSPWTHRSDVFITSSQNPRIKSKVDMAEVPGVGEIQERFNPRPYFAYGQIPGKSSVSNRMPPTVDATYKTPELSKDVLPQIPFLPTQPPKAHADLYTSPYSSYNPPPSNTDDKDKDSFDSPPNETDIQPDEGAGPPEDQHPLIGSDDSVSFPDPPSKGKKPNHHSYTPDESDSEGAEYFPPDDDHHNPKEIILDHPPPGYENHGSVEMAPPPPPPNFPQYLYDDPHHADHIYQEIEHTTPQEKERVNKAHYSYYYLGRKLWYIPLYFSVYFIIYVAVLILKSIARHKVNLKHNFVANPDDHRSGREFKFNGTLDAISRNVNHAIEVTTKKYSNLVM